MSIKLKASGSFYKTEQFLRRMIGGEQYKAIEAIVQRGCDELAAVTPKDTGITAASWTYRITQRNGFLEIAFINYNKVQGVPLVILLRYGHGTGNGGYVKGRDFITPVTEPIFNDILESVWREVVNS